MKGRTKPVPGHRLAGCRYLVQTYCECGWESGRWIGKGARGQAYAEFRIHQDKCEAAK